MREAILAAPKTAPFNIGSLNSLPYTASIANATVDETNTNGNASWFNQAGLGIKTYLSDRFNNWLSTEWIDGDGGGSTPIRCNPIAQTSGTGASGQTTPLGNLGAMATALTSGHGFNASFTEHGMFIGLVNVRAEITYQQGLLS